MSHRFYEYILIRGQPLREPFLALISEAERGEALPLPLDVQERLVLSFKRSSR